MGKQFEYPIFIFYWHSTIVCTCTRTLYITSCLLLLVLLEHEIFLGTQLLCVVDIRMLDELRLWLVPEDVFLQLRVDLIFIDNCHAHFEMSVEKLVQLKILKSRFKKTKSMCVRVEPINVIPGLMNIDGLREPRPVSNVWWGLNSSYSNWGGASMISFKWFPCKWKPQ